MITLGFDLAQFIGLLSGVVLPLLVGLVTTRVTNGGIKAIALAALSVGINLLSELGTAITAGTAYDLGAALLAGLGTFLVAVGMHYGLWKPTGSSAAAQNVLVKSGGES